MAKKKKTTPAERKVLRHVERVRRAQEDLALELEKIKKEIEEMGVLGLGEAKKKG